MNEDFNTTTEDLKKKNEEIIKLLSNVLNRLDDLEDKVKSKDKGVNIHDIILYLIIVGLILTVLCLVYKKK